MMLVTIHSGTMTFQHPRALLEFGSSTIMKELMGEGIADDLMIEMPEVLEAGAAKAGLEIVCSKTGGWELKIMAPVVRAAISPASPRRMKASWSTSSVSSRSTKSSASNGSSGSARNASEKEASLWYVQLFEVGRYLNSEAVCNIATSGYRRGRRSLSVRSHIYRDIDYLNGREPWSTKLGEFVVAMLAFDAKFEDELPEWIEQLLEDAPYETFEAIKKQWDIVSHMHTKAIAGWKDLVDPCVAMGCPWHDHKGTRSCVEGVEKLRWRAQVESLSAPSKGRAGKLQKTRSY